MRWKNSPAIYIFLSFCFCSVHLNFLSPFHFFLLLRNHLEHATNLENLSREQLLCIRSFSWDRIFHTMNPQWVDIVISVYAVLWLTFYSGIKFKQIQSFWTYRISDHNEWRALLRRRSTIEIVAGIGLMSRIFFVLYRLLLATWYLCQWPNKAQSCQGNKLSSCGVFFIFIIFFSYSFVHQWYLTLRESWNITTKAEDSLYPIHDKQS